LLSQAIPTHCRLVIVSDRLPLAENFDGGIRKLSTGARNARKLLDAQAKNALLITLEPAKRWSLDECSIAKIKELRDASIQTAKSISQAHASCLPAAGDRLRCTGGARKCELRPSTEVMRRSSALTAVNSA
jgi:hypothetical protein